MNNRALTPLFAFLVVVNVAYLLLGFASVPLYFERVTTLTVVPYQFGQTDFASNALFQQEAAKRGLSLSQYAVEQIVFASVMVLLFTGMAALVVSRARRNWFAWYTAFFLLFIAEYGFEYQVYVARLLPPQVYDADAVFWPLILLYLFLFPNGRPSPRPALWIVLPVFLIHFLFQLAGALLEFFPSAREVAFFDQVATSPLQILVMLGILVVLASQVYRYRRASSPLEKQQTKWFLLGLSVFSFSFVTLFIPKEYFAFGSEIGLLWFAFVPLAIGVAVLRYHLWDIDLIIRRTLIYGVLTAFLALVYFGSVTLLQRTLSIVTGPQPDLAIVISTLAIAVLAIPLQNRVQGLIDRRFYRQKYDAAKVLARFGEKARDEVDIEKLRAELLAVVEETMQPATASVWLRPTDEKRPARET